MTKRIKIVITDNGKGMDSTFVRDKLGEPWAKEDNYATGSGLSVHLAYRIIDLMGGHMEISSAPGQGCRVELEVPVPRRVITMADSSKDVGDIRNPDSDSPAHLAKRPEEFAIGKKVVFIGFDREGPGAFGRQALVEALEHQYTKLGCELADFETAELAIVDGRLEETDEGIEMIGRIKTDDIVFLVGNEHEALPAVLGKSRELGKNVRRFRKPATPSILRESLFPGHSKALLAEVRDANGHRERQNISSPERVTRHGRTASTAAPPDGKEKPRLQFADQIEQYSKRPEGETPELIRDNAQTCPIAARIAAMWKPRNMDVEDAVASLSLGDYFSSRRRTSLMRANSNNSSNTPSTPTFASSIASGESDSNYVWTPQVGVERDFPTSATMSDDGSYTHSHRRYDTDGSRMNSEAGQESEEDEEPEEAVKVMVVEDNMVNRKILVKILTSRRADQSFKLVRGRHA